MRSQPSTYLLLFWLLWCSPLNGQVSESIADTANILPVGKNPFNLRILKIGWIKNDVSGGYYDVSFEHSIRKHLSIQFDAGCFPYNRSSSRYFGSYFSYHLGVEGRYYFLLRKLPIDGFYIGPYASQNQITWFHRNVHRKAQVAKWTQLGLSFGLQKSIFDNFTIGAGVKGGYGGEIQTNYYDVDGIFLGGYPMEFSLSLFYQFSLGYKF